MKSLLVFPCLVVAEVEVSVDEACDKGMKTDPVGLMFKSELITNARALIFSSKSKIERWYSFPS